MTEPVLDPIAEPVPPAPSGEDDDGAGATDPTEGSPPAAGADAAATHIDPPAPANDADASLLALVDRLAIILERSDLLELEVESGGTGLRLRKPEAAPPSAAATAIAAGGTSAAGAGPREQTVEPAGRPSVKAPLTGIWYSAPAPGTAPFVEVGREVAVGQVIGLIEAMKLFNEIKSDLAGRVVKVMADSGQLVKAKQSLIEVEPL